MADAKQSHLNGAYYGPSIPPTKSYHSHGRGGSGCGFCCLPCCLLSLLFKIIVSVAITIGIAVLIFWLIFRPNRIKFQVNDAVLTQFNIDDKNMLHYNLTLDMNIRNPNKRIGVYYDRIEARTYYDDKRFHSIFLTPFYQGHKNTTILHPVFNGLTFVPNALTEFNKDKGDESFNIEVILYLRIRFKVGRVKTTKFKPKIKCDLNVPLTSSTNSQRFTTKKCKLDF